MITADSRFGDYVQAAIAAEACQPAIDFALNIDQDATAEQGVTTMTRSVHCEDDWALWALTNGPEIDQTLRQLWLDKISSQLAIDQAIKDSRLPQSEKDQLSPKRNLNNLVVELVNNKADNPVLIHTYLEELEDVLPPQAVTALRNVVLDKAPHLINGMQRFNDAALDAQRDAWGNA